MPNEFPLPSPTPPLSNTTIPNGVLPPPPEENAVLPPTYEAPQPEAAPRIKTSPFKIVVPLFIGLIILALIVFVGSKIFSLLSGGQKAVPVGADKSVTINYWGLWESPNSMKPVIAAFESANPGIKVNYQVQSHQDYQDRALTTVSSQNTPDVIRLHSTWLPVFIKFLMPAPANTVSASEIQANYYPVVANSMVVNNQVYGVPVAMDGLSLFVNTAVLKQKNIGKISTWQDLADAAKQLTVRNESTGKIERAGVALGTTSNITAWPDIVSVMMLQAGVNLLKPEGESVNEALKFYASFANDRKLWDDTMPNSTLAFANEKVAMIIAPLWIIPEVSAINPSFTWEVRPLPQLPDSTPVNWASFWVESVPKNAPHKEEAWKFVSYLSSAKAQQLLFESAVKERGSAQTPANKAAAAIAQQNSLNSSMVQDLTTAQTFYTASMTHDGPASLNSRLIKYLEDAVNASIQKQEVKKIVETLSLGFNQVLSQYQLVTPLPTPTTAN